MLSSQLKALIKIELCNLYGFNVFRYSKDKSEKNKKWLMLLVWILVIGVVCFYVGGLSFGLIFLQMSELVPAYLFTLASMVILFFGIFKAGSVIFKKNGYDLLCSMPIKKENIIISRFVRMYVENLALTFVVVLPGLIVYAVLCSTNLMFYLMGILCMLFVPFIPVTVATIVGAVVTAISSRMKHKELIGAFLSVASALGIFWIASRISAVEEEFNPEMLKEMSQTVYEVLRKLYAPAVWMGDAMLKNNFLPLVISFIGSVTIFGIMVFVIAKSYDAISNRLYSTYAKHVYRLKKMKHSTVLSALVKKEAKRYFSSTIYVTNTIMGLVMGVVASAALFFWDSEKMSASFPTPIPIEILCPFFLGGIFSMLPTTAASISLEGKNWWITKSMPLRTRDVLNGKLVFNLCLVFPFYVVAVVLQIIALRPDMMQLLWIVIVPAIVTVFNCTLGLTLNLKFPVFNWESEVAVVKQSMPTVISSVAGIVSALVGAMIAMALPNGIGTLLACLVLLALTVLLYRSNNKTNLQKLS